jgi:hypothetical protein
VANNGEEEKVEFSTDSLEDVVDDTDGKKDGGADFAEAPETIKTVISEKLEIAEIINQEDSSDEGVPSERMDTDVDASHLATEEADSSKVPEANSVSLDAELA